MNETQLPDPKLDAPPPEETPEKRGSVGGRILAYSFLASVVINLGWLAWVSSSNLFGGKAPLDLHPQVIKMVKIAQKPKPKPPKLKPPPPPPPPKQKPPPPLKTPPRIKPRVQPKVQPRPTPPRPRPAAPTHQVNVVRSNRSVSNVPAVPQSDYTAPGPVNPGVETHAPEVKPTPTPDPTPTPTPDPTPTPVVVKAPPVVHHDPPPKPDPPKPKGWVPIDMQQADYPNDLGGNIDTNGIDQSSISNPNVVFTFTIDEKGRAKNVHLETSCGNSEMDNRVLDAARRMHCTPAIQDHIPREQPEKCSFPVSS